MKTTAADIIAASETPVITYSGQPAIGTDLWTAVVTIQGDQYEYVFVGDHHDDNARPLGIIRRIHDHSFVVCRCGGGVQTYGDRESGIRSLRRSSW